MGYCKPFKRGVSRRSQNYGSNPNNGTNGSAGHSGIDEACAIGSEVHAAGDGVVEYAGQFDGTYADNLLWLIDFGGNCLVLNCGGAEPTFVYAHLSEFLVKPGERVRKGQVIALSGNSGTRTTGPHCHVEAIPPGYVLNSPSLGRVNPDNYLTEWPDDIGSIAPQGTITTEEDEDMAITDDDARKIVRFLLDEVVTTEDDKPNTLRWFLASHRKGREEDRSWILDGIFSRKVKVEGAGEAGDTSLGAEIGWFRNNFRRAQK